MGDLNSVITFLDSGLNSDDSLEVMPLGDAPTTFASPGRQNVMIPPNNYGKLEDAWGTALLPGTAVGETVRYMGHGLDTDNEWCYYFFKGEGADVGKNYLFGVNIRDTSDIRQVLVNEPELEMDGPFKKAVYIDGWLYYAGGRYGPKKVHVTRAMNFTLYKNSAWDVTVTYNDGDKVLCEDGGIYECLTNATTGGSVPYLDVNNVSPNWVLSAYAYPNTAASEVATLLDGAFDLVDLPPTTPVTGTYESNASMLYNNLRGRMFQFTYRWKYRDGGFSNTAPFSELFLPPDVEAYNGEILNSFATNNELVLYFNGGSPAMIEYLELYVRTSAITSWQYVDKIDAGVNTYSFYNDFIMEVADDDTVEKLDNYIPRETRALELLSENVLALGGNKFGFNNVTPDVALTVGWENVTLNAPGSTLATYSLGTEKITYPPESIKERHWLEVIVPSIAALSVGDLLYIDLYYTTGAVNIFYMIQAGDLDSITVFRDKCIELINNEGAIVGATADTPPSSTSITLSNGDFCVYIDGSFNTFNTTTSTVYVADSGSGTVNKWSQFTTGARHSFGITYFDRAMRPFVIAANADTNIYVPTVVEAKGSGETYDWKNYIDWEIKHEAPAEAKYWQWFYAGNQNIDDFWFYVIDSVTATTATALSIVITRLQDIASTYPLSQIPPYVWQAGDRLRAITKTASDSAYGALVDTPMDVEIKSFDADTGTIVVATSSSNTYDLGADSLIEIYRPKTTPNEDLFFAFGPIYETYVFSGNVYHVGATQDQTGETTGSGAKGRFNEGDSYLIARAYKDGLGTGDTDTPYLVESKSYSDFYDSDWYTQGKLNIRSNIGEVELNNIAISNKLIQDTGINGLSTFEYDDVVELPDKYGYINAMRQVGNVLKVIQQRKRTSFYVGMTELVDAYGNVNVVKSSEILGTRRELDGDWGTENPETVVQVGDMVFFWDLHNRAVVQDSENGAYAISDNKMRQFFIEMGDDIIGALYYSEDYHLMCDYDETTQTLFLGYYIENTGSRVLCYHLPSKRWSGTLYGANFGTLFNGLIGVKNKLFWVYNGALYEWNSTNDRREFLGSTTKETGFIKVVGNNQPLVPKLIETVGVIANEHTGWVVDDVTIPADPSNKVPAVSKAIEWTSREGVTRAPVKRNMYTSGVTRNADLWEGEKMRGRVCTVKFTLPTQTSGAVEVTALEIGMNSK